MCKRRSASTSSGSRAGGAAGSAPARRTPVAGLAAAAEAWSSSSTGSVAGHEGPADHLQPGDVRRRQRQQPPARAAEPARASRATDASTASPGQQHPLRGPGRARTSRRPAARGRRPRPTPQQPERSRPRCSTHALGCGCSRAVAATPARIARSWQPPRSGSPARARAPCPPPSPPCSPAPASRRTSTARCGGRRCSRWSSRWRCRSASTTPTTTPTASAAPTPTGSARCGWSGSGAAHAGARSSARRSLAFGVAGVAGLVLAATTAWWLRRGRRCVCVARRVVLHRRLAALRLPRARRGHGLRLLRAGRGARHDVRPDRDVASSAALYAAVGVGALACAILVANNLRDIPTDTVAGKRTLAVRARRPSGPACLYALLVLAAAAAVVAVAAATTWWALLGLGFLVLRGPGVAHRPRRRDRPGPDPGAPADRPRELLWAVLVAGSRWSPAGWPCPRGHEVSDDRARWYADNRALQATGRPCVAWRLTMSRSPAAGRRDRSAVREFRRARCWPRCLGAAAEPGRAPAQAPARTDGPSVRRRRPRQLGVLLGAHLVDLRGHPFGTRVVDPLGERLALPVEQEVARPAPQSRNAMTTTHRAGTCPAARIHTPPTTSSEARNSTRRRPV